MQVFHNEDAFGCNWQIFAELLVATHARLVNFEMRSQVADFNDAEIIFLDNAAVRRDDLWQ